MQPDLAGFRAAQERLAANFGALVEFSIPAAPSDVTWPVDTGIDPETGFPFDPTVEPETGGAPVLVTVRAEVVHRTVGQGDQTTFGALGWVEGANMALILGPDSKELVEGATEVTVFDERQLVMSFRPDGIQPDTVDRWICFTQGE